MIQSAVDSFMARKKELMDGMVEHPEDYECLVRKTWGAMFQDERHKCPDMDKMVVHDWGEFQGTLHFIAPAAGHLPNSFYLVSVGYGSCSCCDTIEGIKNYSDRKPDEEQLKDYWTLMLHIAQKTKEICGYDEEV